MKKSILILLVFITLGLYAQPVAPRVEIISASDIDGSISFKTAASPAAYDGDWFNMYRNRNFPIYLFNFDSSSMYLNRSTIRYQFDMSAAPGVGQDSLNYFYVFNTVDSVSPLIRLVSDSLSNCIGEFDQKLLRRGRNTTNYITLPCMDNRLGSPYSSLTIAASYFSSRSYALADSFSRFNIETQLWEKITWWAATEWHSITDTLSAYEVIKVNLSSHADSIIFSTNVPGIIFPDTSYNFEVPAGYSKRSYWIMLPMEQTTYLKSLYSPTADTLYLKHIATDIGAAYCSSIKFWNNRTASFMTGAIRIGSRFYGGNSSIYKAFPGRAVFITFTSTRPEPWPPHL